MKKRTQLMALFSTVVLGTAAFTQVTPLVSQPVYAAETVANTDLATLANGTYTIGFGIYKTDSNLTKPSSMAHSFANPATVYINGDKATVSFTVTSQATMDMMTEYNMGPDADTQYQATKSGLVWTVTVPKSILAQTIATSMGIDTHSEKYGIMKNTADVVFDASKVTKLSDASLPDGTYTANIANYKTGTDKASSMDRFLGKTAQLEVSGSTTKITLTVGDEKTFAMMLAYSIGASADSQVAATKSVPTADNPARTWTVELPTSLLTQKLATGMDIDTETSYGVMHNTADMVIDPTSAVALSPLVDAPAEKPAQPTNPATPAPSEPITPETPTGSGTGEIVAKEVRDIAVLKGDENATSVAADYFKGTVSVDRFSDGSADIYLTSHTPAMMGNQPITIPGAEVTGAAKVGDYYETTYRLHMTKWDENALLPTTIHVAFTQPIVYDATYEIRLAFGSQINLAQTAQATPIRTLLANTVAPVSTANTTLTTAPITTEAEAISPNKVTAKPEAKAQVSEKTATAGVSKNDSNTVLILAATALVAALAYVATLFVSKKLKR